MLVPPAGARAAFRALSPAVPPSAPIRPRVRRLRATVPMEFRPRALPLRQHVRAEGRRPVRRAAARRRLAAVRMRLAARMRAVRQRAVRQRAVRQRVARQRAVRQRTVRQRTVRQRTARQRTARQRTARKRTARLWDRICVRLRLARPRRPFRRQGAARGLRRVPAHGRRPARTGWTRALHRQHASPGAGRADCFERRRPDGSVRSARIRRSLQAWLPARGKPFRSGDSGWLEPW